MKHSLILIIFLTWSISGCSFLGFHSDPYGLEDNEEIEESTAEGEAQEEEEWEEEEEAEEEGEEKPGFFARLMSFGGDDDEDMEVEEDEDGEEGYEEEGEEQTAEDQTDENQTYADMEGYGDEDSEMNADMEDYEDYEEVESDEEESPSTATASMETNYENSPLPPPPTKITKLISVKKIKTSPYRRSGFLVNAVYLARPGDTIESVSQKIYGQDRSGDLYSINPHFRSRPLKTGDKVYYPSLQRPNDSSQLLVYYEDVGLSPNYYSLERGQNIRSIARNLLGSPDSWKEIWATNFEIQSKGSAEKTVQLRYWDGSGTPPPPQPQEVAQMPEETFPEEPPQQMPEPQNTAVAPVESPPPMEENFGDPLPDPSSQPQETGIVETIKKNKLLAIGLIAFIALLLLLMKRIIHKLRNSDDEFDYTKTSIDNNNKISI
ncbi:MAG: hypothetical protein OXB86_05125 [Bdellovibrionales bacterium]|nr:hypothetical protein [Bdellovibrionales bacterium]